ncbi:MAG TPA: methyltransferase domain-containing protein [Gaiellaceae bacterium]|jgi:SAM-dependent methyltransferase
MWNSDAAYDNFMGRFSSRLAPVFADFAGVQAGERVLDVGAGTGMLTQELVRRGAVASAIEPAPAFAASLRRRFPDLDAREGSAEQLPWEDGSFDVALAQLVVAFMDDAPAGVAEMARVANGRVAVCMWDLEGQQLLASVNHVRARMGEEPTEPRRYRTAAEIEELLGPGAEGAALDVEADYADFEDYWSSLLGGAGPLGAWVASLDGERRETARAELLEELGNPSGSFTLKARCWAARKNR